MICSLCQVTFEIIFCNSHLTNNGLFFHVIDWRRGIVICCRLKSAELVLGSIDELNQVIGEHEQTLTSYDTMSSDRDMLNNTLQRLQVS